jgi:8-oxo-dGTP diphosphatase
MIKKRIEVVAAVIIKDDLIFCAQRGLSKSLPLKWEFPGGKVESNESNQEALAREIKEEFDSVVLVEDHLISVEHEYETFIIILHAYKCKLLSGSLNMTEHIAKIWISKSKLLQLDWAPADVPVVRHLMNL